MTQDDKFLRVLFPPSWRVHRVQLVALTLGHYLLLRRLGNPFVSTAKEARYGGGDLAQALFVCSRPWREALAAFERRSWWMKLRLLMLTWYGAKLVDGASQFQAYMLDALSMPVVIYAGGKKSRRLNAPYWLVMIRRRRASGRTLGEVLDEPMKLTSWEDASAGEEAGTLDWCSEAEIAAQNLARQLIAAQKRMAAQAPPVSPDIPDNKDAVAPTQPANA